MNTNEGIPIMAFGADGNGGQYEAFNNEGTKTASMGTSPNGGLSPPIKRAIMAKDVPKRCLVGGVPSKLLKKGIEWD